MLSWSLEQYIFTISNIYIYIFPLEQQGRCCWIAWSVWGSTKTGVHRNNNQCSVALVKMAMERRSSRNYKCSSLRLSILCAWLLDYFLLQIHVSLCLFSHLKPRPHWCPVLCWSCGSIEEMWFYLTSRTYYQRMVSCHRITDGLWPVSSRGRLTDEGTLWKCPTWFAAVPVDWCHIETHGVYVNISNIYIYRYIHIYIYIHTYSDTEVKMVLHSSMSPSA